ncbi:MAG TPA: hypothetical protein VHL14_11135 [Steroidobacteraceae bacterium]|nr:hypothetical protein [Steroidobacteraceae bacterium]
MLESQEIEKLLAEMRMFDEVMNNPTHHGNELPHLRGTHALIAKWNGHPVLQRAALCHNAYDIDRPGSFSQREKLQLLIAPEAERIVYLFCALSPRSLIQATSKDQYVVNDSYADAEIQLTREDMSALLTLALANWLEQRPREAAIKQQSLLEEFRQARQFLPDYAYRDFMQAYGLVE